MNHTMKVWLIVAACLTVLGMLLFCCVMLLHHWDFTKLSTGKYVTVEFNIRTPIERIELDTETENIYFVLSSDDTAGVTWYGPEKACPAVSAEGGTLKVCASDTRSWLDSIGIFMTSPRLTICLPSAEYTSLVSHGTTGNLDIPAGFRFQSADITSTTGNIRFSAAVEDSLHLKVTTGNIHVDNICASEILLDVTTGNILADHISCGTLCSTGTTGNLILTDLQADRSVQFRRTTGNIHLRTAQLGALSADITTGNIKLEDCICTSMELKTTTGNVTFSRSDASDITIRTTTGNVTGSLLTEKIFLTETSTGTVRVPQSAAGGTCSVKTSTGNIRFTIEP